MVKMISYLRREDVFVVLGHLGIIIQGIGVAVLPPIIVALIYNEGNYLAFLIPSVFSILTGYALRKVFAPDDDIKLKHSMIIAALVWLWAALIGSLCLIYSLKIDFLNAFFESMSAWSGSGLTIFTNVEILPKSVLFLRSLEQWIGGLGVVIVVIGILIRPGTAAARLYKAETREERIKPSIVNTIKTIWWIYLLYTILGIALYVIAGMSLFDAINNTMTNLSTGGMSIKNDNIGAYHSDLIYFITIILMILGGTSFLVHYRALKGKIRDVLRDVQFQAMVIIVFLFSTLLIVNAKVAPMDSVYHVVSALTCTGSSILPSSSMIAWPEYVKIILATSMIIGCAAGSTTGAIKLIRVVVLLKSVYWEIVRIVSPVGSVIPRKIVGRSITDAEIREAGSYTFIYLLFIFISWIVLVSYGYNAINSLFEVCSAQGNVGLSMGIVSPTMADVPKSFLILNMWIGRLEIIPILVLLRASLDIFKKI